MSTIEATLKDTLDPVVADYLKARAGTRRMSFDPRLIKILVVDDEKVARFMIQALLKKSGYEDVTMVESAKDALDLMNKEAATGSPPFSLIISDVKMPGMNGLEFLEELSKHEQFNGIPIIMMSALDELPLVYQCLQQGACDYLTKPVKQGMVQNLWQNVWRKRKERKLLDMYQTEQGVRSRTEEELKQEITTLHKQVSDAISTPIKAISDAMMNLLSDGNLTPSVRSTLSSILKNMQSSNIYRPAVEEYILQKAKEQMDPQTREWFKYELSLTESTPHTNQTPEGIRLRPSYSDIITQLRSWEFDVWQITDESTLYNMIIAMFQDFGLLETYKIEVQDLQRLLTSTRALYYDKNPYHNFRHAFDVVHMSYLLISNAEASKYLGSMEVLALLLCGFLHDVDHPGVNNTFQIVTESELAIRYNDQSVLENHHCATAFKLLKQCGIWNKIPRDEKQKLRKLIIDCIIATDLSKHMKMLSDFESLLDSTSCVLHRDNEEHRASITRMLMKAADLSNPAKPFPISRYWANMVQEEFFLQGDQEKIQSISVSPFMDRDSSSLPQMQVNFSGFIVIPLFQSLAKVFPVVETKIISSLLNNRQRWSELLKAEQQMNTIFNEAQKTS